MATYRESCLDLAQKAKATRQSFGEQLAAIGERDNRLVVLDADLSKSTKTEIFAKKFPNRFFDMGIAEANMISVASGLALSGKVSCAASFGCFLTGRFDQIRMSASFTGANVRLVGTHAGVGIGEDGHSQMALEDIALMRILPNMTVFQPADDWETKQFMDWSMEHQGPCYLRLSRQNLPALNRKTKDFRPGRWDLLTDIAADAEVAILATGGVLENAVGAADVLKSMTGKSSVIVNCNWLKPIDEELLLKIVKSSVKKIVTIEDHYTTGGLGGVVAEYVSQLPQPKTVQRIGVRSFGQSGTPEKNYEQYGFTSEKLAQEILRA